MCILEFCSSFHLQNQTTSKYFIFIAEICTINSVQCCNNNNNNTNTINKNNNNNNNGTG